MGEGKWQGLGVSRQPEAICGRSGPRIRHGGPGSEAISARLTTLCWVRHGETDWNAEGRLQGQEDVPLNARGWEQARTCAAYLAQQRWDAVVTSPLSRARMTAAVIAEACGTGFPVLMPPLMERYYGAASGLLFAERQARFPDGQPSDLESLDDLRTRVEGALQTLCRDYAGQRVVVVSHGGTINMMLAILSGGTLGTGRTTLANCSLTGICHVSSTNPNRPATWTIEYYNRVITER